MECFIIQLIRLVTFLITTFFQVSTEVIPVVQLNKKDTFLGKKCPLLSIINLPN